jgi:hypothetical protein
MIAKHSVLLSETNNYNLLNAKCSDDYVDLIKLVEADKNLRHYRRRNSTGHLIL